MTKTGSRKPNLIDSEFAGFPTSAFTFLKGLAANAGMLMMSRRVLTSVDSTGTAASGFPSCAGNSREGIRAVYSKNC